MPSGIYYRDDPNIQRVSRYNINRTLNDIARERGAINLCDPESAMQWALQCLLRGKEPPQELWNVIPSGNATEAFQALTDALADDEEGKGVRKVFQSLCSTDAYKWLGDLRSKPFPIVPGIEVEEEKEKEDPRFTKGKNDRQILKLSSIEDIYNLSDPEYLISKVLQTASVSLIYGVSGTGKTFTCLDLALSIAHGIAWRGRKVKQGPVWFVNTEGGRALKKRLKAWYQEHPGLLPSPDFKVIPWSLDLRENYQTRLDTLKDQDEAPILILFYNFSMCTDKVNQNLQEEVAAILRRLHFIADSYECHIMIVHHTNKEGDVNGTMAFRNHVDNMIELKKEDKSQKDSPILFSSQKARDDEPFGDIRIELKTVNLYADPETGEWLTSCVIADCEQAEPEKFVPQTQKQVLEILKAHGQLTCAQWLKHCASVYQMSETTFYRLRGIVEKEGLATTTAEKVKGKSVYYSLTEKGHEFVG